MTTDTDARLAALHGRVDAMSAWIQAHDIDELALESERAQVVDRITALTATVARQHAAVARQHAALRLLIAVLLTMDADCYDGATATMGAILAALDAAPTDTWGRDDVVLDDAPEPAPVPASGGEALPEAVASALDYLRQSSITAQYGPLRPVRFAKNVADDLEAHARAQAAELAALRALAGEAANHLHAAGHNLPETWVLRTNCLDLAVRLRAAAGDA